MFARIAVFLVFLNCVGSWAVSGQVKQPVESILRQPEKEKREIQGGP